MKSEHNGQKEVHAKKIQILKEKYHETKERNTRDLEELILP